MEKPNLRLFFQVKGIRKKGVFQVVFHQQGQKFVQATEELAGPTPVFKKALYAKYAFQKIQRCNFAVKNKEDKEDYEVVQSKLGDVIGSRYSTKRFRLENGAELFVRAESINQFKESRTTTEVAQISPTEEQVREVTLREVATLRIEGRKLINLDSVFDFINKSDPFFRLFRINADGTTVKCYESETCKNSLNPSWKLVSLPLPSLVDRALNKPFVVEVWDDNKNKRPELIGEVSVYLKDIEQSKGREYSLYNPKHKNPGKVFISDFAIMQDKSEKITVRVKSEDDLPARSVTTVAREEVRSERTQSETTAARSVAELAQAFEEMLSQKLMTYEEDQSRKPKKLPKSTSQSEAAQRADQVAKQAKQQQIKLVEQPSPEQTHKPLMYPQPVSKQAQLKQDELAPVFSKKKDRQSKEEPVRTQPQRRPDPPKEESKARQQPQEEAVQQSSVDRFLQFKRGGLQLTSMICIDFTKSNGEPNSPESLHSSSADNQYLIALRAITDIIRQYDEDSRVQLFGFGAYCAFPKFTKPDVQYLIPLTGDPQEPRVPYEHIEATYRSALTALNFNGPTNVKSIIAEANRVCSKQKGYLRGEKYLVLLILTDGSVDDIRPSIKELGLSANLPVSVIMVGIGTGDFSGMKELLEASESFARPMVQFVQFQRYKSNGRRLAESILRRLPQDVVRFMESKGLQPAPVKEEEEWKTVE